MKKLLTLLLITISGFAFGQTKKKTSKQSEQSIIEAKAKKWFKEVYVATTFKDPYSYKLLKFEIFPVTYITDAESNAEVALDEYNHAKQMLAKIDTLSPNSKYRENKAKYDATKKMYDVAVKEFGEFSNEAKAFVPKMNNQYMYVYSDTAGLQQANEKLERTTKIINYAKSIKTKGVKHYHIDIDCYGSNSYGGKILGRYTFKFNKNGLVGEVIDKNE